MQKEAYKYLGIMPGDFWNLTLKEYNLMIESNIEKREEDIELINGIITKVAFKVGLANRLKRLDYKHLEDKKSTKVEGNAMSIDEHKNYMDELEKRFNKK